MKRLMLKENVAYNKTVHELAAELGLSSDNLRMELEAANEYLSERLSVSNVMDVRRDRFSFNGVAGLFSVSQELEIEVVPKFMSGREAWRSDFLLLLAGTKWGGKAEQRLVGVARTHDKALNDVLAEVFLVMFDDAKHIPIRTYRHQRVSRFEVEGDLLEETVLLPGRDGFEQIVTDFSGANVYNAVIRKAAYVLARSVHDFSIKARLANVLLTLGKQAPIRGKVPRTVPARYGNWSKLYLLSLDILNGYGIDYLAPGDTYAPGFVVRTSDAWEEFLRRALVVGLRDCNVVYQRRYPFAKRDHSVVFVKPDYTIRSHDGRALLVDAKYKYADAGHATIANSDIYEGCAFMTATGINRLILLYPYSEETTDLDCETFQTVACDCGTITGVRVNPSPYATEDLKAFGNRLGSYLIPYFVESDATPCAE